MENGTGRTPPLSGGHPNPDLMTRREPLRRRAYLHLTGLAAAIGAAGCLGDNGDTDDADGTASDGTDTTDDDSSESTTGLLSTEVTDQPGDIADFESCVVTIDGTWIKPSGDLESDEGGDGDENESAGNETADSNGNESAGNESESEGENGLEEQDEDDVDQGEGRRYLEFEEPQEADLVQLQDGNTQLIDEREVETGEYQFLQLDVSSVDGILEDGEEAEVETPGNAPLQFNRAFEIRGDERTTFVGDFTPVRRGQSGRYLLQPVARRTDVIYEDDEPDETDDTETEAGNETTDGGNETEAGNGTDTDGDDGNETVSDDNEEADA